MSTSPSSAIEPKQARAQETLRKLLTAAVDELLENGYARLSTSAVARRAGCSRGAQQNYFPHKQTLVMEAVRHLGRLQREAVRERVEGVPQGRARVQAGLDVLFEAYSGPLFASVVELSLAARHDAALGEVIESEERATSQAMQETATDIFGPSFPETRDAAQRWAMVLSAIRGLALLKLLGHPEAAVERQWTATRRQLLDLLADEPAGTFRRAAEPPPARPAH
jgi:AcrR family transcriptional regulator